MFNTGLESFIGGPKRPTPILPDVVDAESSDDSMDGNGSRSLSRLRDRSYGGGVRDLCRGDAAYE